MPIPQQSLDDIKAVLTSRSGIARANRFNVIINVPAKIQNLMKSPAEMAILCDSCSLPGRVLHTIDYITLRQPSKIPFAYTNDDVQFSFHLTNDYYLKYFFDAWLNLAMDANTYRSEYLENYASDIIIQQLDGQNNVIYAIKLLDAFPMVVSPITLDNSGDTLQKLSIHITYDDYVVMPKTT